MIWCEACSRFFVHCKFLESSWNWMSQHIDGFFGPMQVIIISHIFIRIIIDISMLAVMLLGIKEGILIFSLMRNLRNIFTIIGFVFGNEIIKRKVLEYLTISYRIFNNWFIYQVSTLVKQLNKRKFTDEALARKVKLEFHSQLRSILQLFALQVDLFVIKIKQHSPRISPMGMFELSPDLFPTVEKLLFLIKWCCSDEIDFLLLHLQMLGVTITYVLVIMQNMTFN